MLLSSVSIDMKIQDKVCSLELAKQLKKFEVKQDSLFYWSNYGTFRNGFVLRKSRIGKFKNSENYWSAFTVSELGEMLQWEKLYIFGFSKELLDYVDGKNTEADARAKMLIYLLENGLIKNE
jgi:hypothetical protein